MKNRFAMVMACCACAALVCVAQEKSTLPLPDPGNVTLTLDEYNRLVELAAKPPKRPDTAPLPYSIKHADLKLRVEKDSVSGTVELDGEVFRKGVSKVPLTSGMTIFDAHQNGKGIPLIQENGTHVALLPGPGEFSVALDAGLPLRIEVGRASFSLPAPVAGSVQLTLVIPGDHTIANISSGLITSRKSEDGHTAIEATLVPGQPANIWWATRETASSGSAEGSSIPRRQQDAGVGERSGDAGCSARQRHGRTGRSLRISCATSRWIRSYRGDGPHARFH